MTPLLDNGVGSSASGNTDGQELLEGSTMRATPQCWLTDMDGVLVREEHSVPIVSCRLFYATGSVHEHPGGTGIAHMLEHQGATVHEVVAVFDPEGGAYHEHAH